MSPITSPVELLNAALARIEERVNAVASVSRLNAMLALADPAWVLPRPALARLTMGPSATQVLRHSHRFRCSEGTLGEDILFTSVLPDVELHPWVVKQAQWIAIDLGHSLLARGLRIQIEQQEGFRRGPGWLSMHVSGGPVIPWAMSSVRAVVAGLPAETRSWAARMTSDDVPLPLAHPILPHIVESVAQGLIEIRLDAARAAKGSLTVELHFEQPIPIAADPRVELNSCLVWNSVPHSYPDLNQIEQSVSGRPHVLVHELTTEGLGNRWRAWRIKSTSETTGRSHTLSGEREYHLAFTPVRTSLRREPGPPARLAIVLHEAFRSRLDALNEVFVVEFLATQGSDANGLKSGARVQLIDSQSPFEDQTQTGQLVTDTWSGSDGLDPVSIQKFPAHEVQAFLPFAGAREVADVSQALRTGFGDELELLDPWDLLRTREDGLIGPLNVRVRFRRSDRGPSERDAILRAAESCLNRYVGESATARIVLRDVESAP
jgi:hypothetical protein